jgi:hypothetical protein
MRPRRLTPVSPRPRHRHLTTDTTGAHKHRIPAPTLDEQHLQPLPTQRMKGMRNNNKTQTITGRRGTMPPPSAPLKFWCLHHAASVFPPPAPAAENNSPRTSDGGSGTGAVALINSRSQNRWDPMVSHEVVLLRGRGQIVAPFPVPARQSVHAVLPHTAYRRRSPPAFGFSRQSLKGLGATTVLDSEIRPRWSGDW